MRRTLYQVCYQSPKPATEKLIKVSAFDSGIASQAATVTESGPTAKVEHAWNMGN